MIKKLLIKINSNQSVRISSFLNLKPYLKKINDNIRLCYMCTWDEMYTSSEPSVINQAVLSFKFYKVFNPH